MFATHEKEEGVTIELGSVDYYIDTLLSLRVVIVNDIELVTVSDIRIVSKTFVNDKTHPKRCENHQL